MYCGAVGALFLGVKLLNIRFNYLFDTTEPIPEGEKGAAALEAEEVKAKSKNVGLNES